MCFQRGCRVCLVTNEICELKYPNLFPDLGNTQPLFLLKCHLTPSPFFLLLETLSFTKLFILIDSHRPSSFFFFHSFPFFVVAVLFCWINLTFLTSISQILSSVRSFLVLLPFASFLISFIVSFSSRICAWFLPTSAGSSKKQQSSRKTSALLTMPKPVTVWITIHCGKF